MSYMKEVELICVLIEHEQFTQEFLQTAFELRWKHDNLERLGNLIFWFYSIRRDLEDGKY